MAVVLQHANSTFFGKNCLNEHYRKPEIPTSGIGFTLKDGPTNQNTRHRHPEYSELSVRLFTYRNWIYDSVQSSRTLAQNGFFYTGEKDKVRCFSCSIGFKDFHSTDDILVEHLRHSPNCTYLTKLFDETETSFETTTLMEKKKNDEYVTKYDPAKANKQFDSSQETTIRSPEFESYDARLSSYTGWPAGKRQTPEQLASAGFFYTGCDDIVRCYACDGGLNCWDPLDDPWIEHARHFQRCPYVRRVKGEEYIGLVHRHYETLLKPKLLEFPKRVGTTIASQKYGFKHQSRVYLSPKRQLVKDMLLDMGFLDTDIDRAFKVLNQDETSEVTVESIIDTIEDMKKVDTKQAPLTSQNMTKIDQVEEHMRLKYELNCKLCQNVPSNVLFLPCQHHCCCSECSEVATICPLCGENIQQKIRTYS